MKGICFVPDPEFFALNIEPSQQSATGTIPVNRDVDVNFSSRRPLYETSIVETSIVEGERGILSAQPAINPLDYCTADLLIFVL